MFFRLPAFLSVLSLLIAGCAVNNQTQLIEDGHSPLPAKEIFSLVAGNTLHLTANNFDGHLFFLRDGKMAAIDRLDNRDTGTWDISSDNMLCFSFKAWYFGDEKCYTLFAEPEGNSYLFFTTNGARYYTGTMMTGDPENLGLTGGNKSKTYLRKQLASGDSSAAAPTPAPQTVAAPATYIASPMPSKAEMQRTIRQMARNCPDCDLAGAELSRANLTLANLAGANLAEANLSKANLRRANLVGGNLAGANLSLANLSGANLSNCNLRNADLSGANLVKADFTGALTEGIKLEGAHLEGTVGLTPVNGK